MTETEAATLQRLMNVETDGGAIEDAGLALGLADKGWVRPAPEGWHVTVHGHLAYLRRLRTSFGEPDPVRDR